MGITTNKFTNEINQIPIIDYLYKKGINPIRKYNRYYRYLSPIRVEKTPSFDVSIEKNLWIDRGIDTGGTLIDLFQLLENCSFHEAVKLLRNESIKPLSNFKQPSEEIVTCAEFSLLSENQIGNKHLIEYLKTRKINIDKVKHFVKEFHYLRNSKKYFALGLNNVQDGIELRNKFFKGVLGSKAITYIKGKSSSILIFEGIMDFLSHLTYSKKDLSNHHFLILNGTGNARAAQKFILKLPSYIQAFHFLDLDDAGRNAVKIISNINRPVTDMSFIYRGYNDYNEMLMRRVRTQTF